MSDNNFSVSAYLMAQRDEDGRGFPEGDSGYRSEYPIAKRIVCADGFSMSVQASPGAYCSPRQGIGPWWEVEVGFPSAPPELIADRAEDPNSPTQSVYGYVGIDLVEQLIELHGGPDEATRAMIKARSQP